MNRSSAVELVFVEVDACGLQFDDHQRRIFRTGAKIPQRAVGHADTRNREIALELIVIRAFGGRLVSEGFAEHFAKEVRIQGRFLLCQVPLGFEVGPPSEDFARAVLLFSPIVEDFRLVGQESAENQPRTSTTIRRGKQIGAVVVFLSGLSAFSHLGGVLSPRHESQPGEQRNRPCEFCQPPGDWGA